MPYACIFVPDFPAEAILRAEPDLRGQPVVILEGKVPLQKVFVTNAEARRNGVKPGMTKLQLEDCAELCLRSRSLLQESTAHAALLDCAQSFSPRVEVIAPDTIVLDLCGMDTLFGPLPKIARNLAQRACEMGMESNVAVAANVDTAIIAALGFSGVTVIAEGQESDKIGGLSVDVLLKENFQTEEDEPPEKIFETFRRWGIRSLRDLATLPDVGVSERLGEQGVYLQKLARGKTSRTLVPVEPPLIFEEAAELEHPLLLLEPLAFLLSRMLEQLCARLGARALATQELRLVLELANGYCDEVTDEETGFNRSTQAGARQCFSRTLRLPIPLLDARTFLKLLQLDLKAHPPGAPILKIHLAAEPAHPRAVQSGLFLPPTPEPEMLELTLSRIAGIVGEDKVGSLELLDTYRHDGFRMQRFAPSEPLDVPVTQKQSEDLVTALRIFRPALPVTITMQDGQPVQVGCPKRNDVGGEIVWKAGPWRCSGDWWEREGWSRDEWDVAVQNDGEITLYRLVHDLLEGRWVIEGTYD